MPSLGIEFTVHLDRDAPGSLPAKLVQAIRAAIEEGGLRPGDQLPPSRILAARVGVSRGTVVAAYEQLVAEGYFVAGQGTGTRVNPNLARLHGLPGARPSGDKHTRRRIASHEIAHHESQGSQATRDPLSDLTVRPAWRAAWRRAMTSPRLNYATPIEGDPVLLEEITEHLRTMRGTLRSPQELLVTAGAREGLALILTVLGSRHGRALVVGFEETSPKTLREVAVRLGANILELPVDEEGLITKDLPLERIDAVVVTPSHQYPRGASLPLERRVDLIAWATRTGTILIEDDFDTELRYVNAPLPTLAALDTAQDGVVLTLGSYSATISPGLSAGFIVTPRNLRKLLLAVRRDLGCPVSPILQLALAELLASGEVRRHVARMRRRRARAGVAG